MTATKSTLKIVLSTALLAGSALLAGCSQPASTSSTEQVSSAPAPVMDSSTSTTQYRK